MATAYHFTDDLKLSDDNDRHKWINEGIKVANEEGAKDQWPSAVEALRNGDNSQVEAQLAPWKVAVVDAAKNLADVGPKLTKALQGLQLTLKNPFSLIRSVTFKGVLKLITGKRDHKVRRWISQLTN